MFYVFNWYMHTIIVIISLDCSKFIQPHRSIITSYAICRLLSNLFCHGNLFIHLKMLQTPIFIFDKCSWYKNYFVLSHLFPPLSVISFSNEAIFPSTPPTPFFFIRLSLYHFLHSSLTLILSHSFCVLDQCLYCPFPSSVT